MGGKSADAFRTISEVSELIGTPAHVLRFWETKFGQIRPVKRAGGRRYYRPADVALIDGIRQLLHEDGMTIRGVQKILRERGLRHVMGLSRFAEGLGGAPEEPPAREEAPVETPVAAPIVPSEDPRASDAAPEMPELPFGEPMARAPAAAAAPADAQADAEAAAPVDGAVDDSAAGDRSIAGETPQITAARPLAAALRRFRPDAAQRSRLAELEPRLAALRDRLAARPPGSAR
ncbi:MAG: MerR family transcriptional regulator [Rhodobacteraceae bacterium]|nr:MerR family transcriptional regulator [Paracoccaceae bacterium]